MYCSNCEKPSNLSLCKQCQKEFQEIEDQMKLDDLAAQDDAELAYEQDDYVDYAKEYADIRRQEAMEMNRDMDELYERELDRWYSQNGY